MSISTRTILISIILIVLFSIFLWSSGEGNKSNFPQDSQTTKTAKSNDHILITSKQAKTSFPDNTDLQQQSQENNKRDAEDINDKIWQARPDLPESISPSQIQNVRQCRPLGKKFAKAVSQWLNTIQHANVTKRLIYSCESHRRGKFCGGMGDRFRGMVSSAFLALLANRRFELFHPVPVPLQQFLKPKLIDWIPRIRAPITKKSSSTSTSSSLLVRATSYQEIDNHMQSIPLNRALMNLKTHKKFIPYFLIPPAADAEENIDLRIQSNTPGFDKYILRDPLLKKRFQDELGLPAQCNLTCYFGCMYGLMFEPSDELEQEMKAALKGFEVEMMMGNDETKEKVPLARAVVEAHRGRISKKGKSSSFSASLLVPIIGLQVRVGGSWASKFKAKEPFRTIPSAFPFIFEDVKYMRNKFSAISSSSLLPVFVTSDSEKFVKEEAVSKLSTNKNNKNNNDQIFFIPRGDCFEHTDTQNVNEAIPEKYKHLKTTKNENRNAYLCTLMNHVVLSASRFLVMGQSGFADTAFWAARSVVKSSDKHPSPPFTSIGFFMDMTNNRIAWEHTLVYKDVSVGGREEDEDWIPSPAISDKNRIIGDVARDKELALKFPFLV